MSMCSRGGWLWRWSWVGYHHAFWVGLGLKTDFDYNFYWFKKKLYIAPTQFGKSDTLHPVLLFFKHFALTYSERGKIEVSQSHVSENM